MNIKKLYKDYSLNTYTRVGPVFVKGKGSWLWDAQGNKYLDLLPGWGVSILGHCHPRIAAAINKQTKKLIHLPNNLFFKEQALLAKEIVKKSFPAKVFFANSGAEGIEGAIKLSRLFGKGKRYELITMKNSFHGRTFGALSATAQAKYKKPFKPILGGFKEAKFNDIKSFKNKVNKKTVGVILELIQGEGGVNVADKDYIRQLKQYCQKHSLLLIIDEVQTGMGRTGKLFAYQNYSITPDIMVLSKGIGAGAPMSAIVVNKKIADIIKPGMHASTFGGSPLVTAASLETFKVIDQEKLLGKVKKNGDYLHKRFLTFKKKYSLVKAVRGKGLMLGIELSIDAQPLFLECLKRKLIINATHRTVLRMLPALNVTRSELDQGLEILDAVLAKFAKKK
ncbi:MAG: aspartate aminotransferase family protein [Candidatus Omnitrophica bacterium]|nr:aspartate aminotransferase family protein [Candidatus Omnitrophota bacterium]